MEGTSAHQEAAPAGLLHRLPHVLVGGALPALAHDFVYSLQAACRRRKDKEGDGELWEEGAGGVGGGWVVAVGACQGRRAPPGRALMAMASCGRQCLRNHSLTKHV